MQVFQNAKRGRDPAPTRSDAAKTRGSDKSVIRLDAAYFLVSVFALIFGYGVIVGKYEVFPYGLLNDAKDAATDIANNWRYYAGLQSTKYIMPRMHEGEGVVTYRKGLATEGLNYMVMSDGEKTTMTLREMTGEVVHNWRLDFDAAFPNPDHIDSAPGDWTVHGAHLYPNGDVVLNFEGLGTAKLDRCSNVVWTLPYKTHHSLFAMEDGSLWITARRYHESAVREFPRIEPPFWEETLIQVSPDGDVLREISVLGTIFRSGYESLLFAKGDDFLVHDDGDDPLHTNNVEVLRHEMARFFPMFAAGDIMVSMRNINTILVIDGTTELIKWSMTGPFLRQHDPDFTTDGKIVLFDNRGATSVPPHLFGGSKILEVDPATQTASIIFEGGDEPFYSSIRGMVQRLPNGHTVVTDSNSGRVFEFDRGGSIVWSFINHLGDNVVGVISQGERLDGSWQKTIVGPC